MKVKKLFKSINYKSLMLTFLVLFATLALQAQEEKTIRDAPNDLSWKDLRHEINFSVGFFNNPASQLYFKECNYDCDFNVTPQDNRTTFTTFVFPSCNFDYTYKFTKWFALGGMLSRSSVTKTSYNNYDASVAKKTRTHYYAIAPKVRFDWLNKKHITLYSAIAAGLGMYYTNNVTINERDLKFAFFADVTLIGVKVGGQRWYGLTELSCFNAGILKFGFGFRF